MRTTKDQKYRVPARLVRYLARLPDPDDVEAVVGYLRGLRLNALPEVRFEGEVNEQSLSELASEIVSRGEGRTMCRPLWQTRPWIPLARRPVGPKLGILC